MDYNAFRHFADSWGLVFLGGVFLCCVGWVLRPKARDYYRDAGKIIFNEDNKDG